MEKLLVKTLIILQLLHFGCNPYGTLINLESDTEIQFQVKNKRIERGVLILNEKYTIWSSNKMINSQSDFKTLDGKYKSFFLNYKSNTIPKIGDLRPPYQIIKRENEDYIRAVKQEDTLKFELIEF